MKTQKETIEFDEAFLEEWNEFCDVKGYVKRQAAHACRIAFMKLLSQEQREKMLRDTTEHLAKGRSA